MINVSFALCQLNMKEKILKYLKSFFHFEKNKVKKQSKKRKKEI